MINNTKATFPVSAAPPRGMGVPSPLRPRDNSPAFLFCSTDLRQHRPIPSGAVDPETPVDRGRLDPASPPVLTGTTFPVLRASPLIPPQPLLILQAQAPLIQSQPPLPQTGFHGSAVARLHHSLERCHTSFCRRSLFLSQPSVIQKPRKRSSSSNREENQTCAFPGEPSSAFLPPTRGR